MDYIPKATRKDVLRIIRRDFSPSRHNAILKMLQEYGSQKWHEEVDRVHLAILKLSDKKFDKIKKYVEIAKTDYRDVIAPAEYPGFWEIGFVGVDELSRKETQDLKDADWEQYCTWCQKISVRKKR
jgi:hypothetical protein